MILRYVGEKPLEEQGRFVVQPGDLVEFSKSEAKVRLEREAPLWEVAKVGNSRESRGSVRTRS